MYKAIILILSIVSFAALNAGDLPVVKVASYPCTKPAQTKFGSGVVIENSGRKYVLTSDHVVFHGNQIEGACHRIYGESLEAFSADLKNVNLGKGMALLELDPKASQVDSISFADLEKEVSIAEGDFSSVCGFPHGSGKLFCDKNGQILKIKSDRTVLPFVKEVIEINGHNEYGMSGGGIFSKDGRLGGVISHQYLQPVLGAPAKLIESTEGMQSGELILLSIPVPTIYAWLKSYFMNRPEDLRYSVKHQLRGKTVLAFDGILFSPRSCQDRDGVDDFWGGDPVGVGGNVSVEGNICEVVLTYAEKNEALQKWPFSEKTWFKNLKPKIESGATAVITGLYYNGRKLPIKSFSNLLSKIHLELPPTIKISDPFTEPNEITKELVSFGAKIRIPTLALKGKFKNDLLIQDLLAQVLVIGELCVAGQFELVDLNDFARLLDEALWKEMMVEELELTVDLKGALYRVRELLRKVQG